MIKLIILLFTLPVIANCSGIKTTEGKYDNIEDIGNTAKIVLDLNKTGQIIDKQFYGTHLDSYSPIPSKLLVDELQVGKIRLGGNEFDVNNWKNNKTITAAGDIKDITNFVDISKIFKNYNVSGIFQINLTGFQPIEVDGHYNIVRTFNEKSAYELVKYLNGTKKLNIVDFSLGNEFSIWNETHHKIWQTTDGVSADEYIDRYIKFAVAVRTAQAEVNGNPNSIKIWGPEISTSWYDWNTGNFTKDCQWTDIPGQVACSYGQGKFDHFIPYFFSRLKSAEKDPALNPKRYKLLDYMAVHYYPNFRTKNTDPTSVITNSKGRQLIPEMLESTRLLNDPTYTNTIDNSSYKNDKSNILGKMKQWIMQYYPDAKLAMNEFAVDSDYRSNSYHPIIRPLYLADVIGILTKENVSFFNQFILSSEKGANLPWSMIVGGEKTDLFYMYKLFTNNFLGKIVNVDDNLGDIINAYAVIKNGNINLAIINKDPVEKSVQIYTKENSTKKVMTYLIPAWSASILNFDKNPVNTSRKVKIYQFGANEMGITPDQSYKKEIKL
jgi:hypothetical protein